MDPLPQQTNDQSLVEVFCKMQQQKGMSNNKLRQVSRVHILLCVITIAELPAPDGTCISLEKFSGNWRNDSILTWPNQPLPTKKMFEIFYHYVRKGFCSNVKRHTCKERLTLDHELGHCHQQKAPFQERVIPDP